jgi:tRNA G18 (ribose-2'-O)-methylase SpoU
VYHHNYFMNGKIIATTSFPSSPCQPRIMRWMTPKSRSLTTIKTRHDKNNVISSDQRHLYPIRSFSLYQSSKTNQEIIKSDWLENENDTNTNYRNYNGRMIKNDTWWTYRINPNTITSTKSNLMKRIQLLLSQRKKRYEYQQTIIEGPRIIYDILSNPFICHFISHIVVSMDQYETVQSKLDSILMRQQQEPKNIRSTQDPNPEYINEDNTSMDSDTDFTQPQPHIVEVIQASSNILDACTDTVSNQGMIAVCHFPTEVEQQQQQQLELQHASTSFGSSKTLLALQQQRPLYLVLDHISDPGNMGTLIRSAVGAGVATIYCIHHCCDPYNPKAIRAAMGTTFLLPIIQSYQNWSDLYSHLIHHQHCTNHRIYAATMLEPPTEQDEEDKDGMRGRRDTTSSSRGVHSNDKAY